MNGLCVSIKIERGEPALLFYALQRVFIFQPAYSLVSLAQRGIYQLLR